MPSEYHQVSKAAHARLSSLCSPNVSHHISLAAAAAAPTVLVRAGRHFQHAADRAQPG